MVNPFGAIGILFGTAVGGRLYDGIGPHAVFVMVGGLSLLVVGYGLWVRRTAPGPLKISRGNFMAH